MDPDGHAPQPGTPQWPDSAPSPTAWPAPPSDAGTAVAYTIASEPSAGYPQSSYSPPAYPPGNPPSSYPPSSYPQTSSPPSSYPPSSYPQTSFPRHGYPPSATGGPAGSTPPAGGHPAAGHPQLGYSAAGYPQVGYSDGSYPQVGHPAGPFLGSPAAPLPPDSRTAGKRRGTLWLIIGAAAAVVVVVIAVIAIGNSSKKQADLTTFCQDFELGWGDVMTGIYAADSVLDEYQYSPTTFTGSGTDNINAISTGIEQASVMANEAPSSIKDKISGISNYLQIMLKVANNDQTAITSIPRNGSFSGDGAELSGTVPLRECAGH